MIEKEFLRWVLRNYTNCGHEELKKKYPGTTKEMNDCFTIDEIYEEYKNKMVE